MAELVGLNSSWREKREKGVGGWKEGRRKNRKNFGNGGQNGRKKKDQLNYLENH